MFWLTCHHVWRSHVLLGHDLVMLPSSLLLVWVWQCKIKTQRHITHGYLILEIAQLRDSFVHALVDSLDILRPVLHHSLDFRKVLFERIIEQLEDLQLGICSILLVHSGLFSHRLGHPVLKRVVLEQLCDGRGVNWLVLILQVGLHDWLCILTDLSLLQFRK